MAELAARHLIQQGAASILVANRTDARAERIADSLRTPKITTGVVPFDDLYAEAHRADIIITSTGAAHQVFTRQHGQQLVQRRRGRPVFFIDIAVPRDVDPDMNKVEGCFVYDIDDLQQTAAANLADRSREAAAAERIVTSEVDRYQQRLETLDAVPAIKALQTHDEQLRQAELDRIAKTLATMSPEQAAAVEALTRSLTNKLLHPQIVALRKDR